MSDEKLAPYQEKVVQEAEELRAKRIALNSFMESEQFGDFEEKDKFVLSQQFAAMTNYLSILDHRIFMFGQ